MTDQTAQPEPPDENKIIAERRGKLAGLREAGNAFPNDFRRAHAMDALARDYGSLDKPALEEKKVEVSATQKVLDGDLDGFIEASLKQGV